MSEEMLIRHCSPTLAGLKTGSLFPMRFASEDAMAEILGQWNHTLSAKGLRVLPLRYRDGKGLIYVFRPSRLRRDLRDECARNLLKNCGYCGKTLEQCISQLIRRMAQQEEFPHEIGLFLGYPPQDVQGFMCNHARNYKCAGVWKVYGDEDAARKTFALYKKCTRIYSQCWANGSDINRLTVAG